MAHSEDIYIYIYIYEKQGPHIRETKFAIHVLAMDQAMARCPGLPALAGLRNSVPGHERVLALDGRRHVRLRFAVLDDLQPGKIARSPGPQGREIDHRDLLQELHQGGGSPRYWRKDRRGPPGAQGLSSLQWCAVTAEIKECYHG